MDFIKNSFNCLEIRNSSTLQDSLFLIRGKQAHRIITAEFLFGHHWELIKSGTVSWWKHSSSHGRRLFSSTNSWPVVSSQDTEQSHSTGLVKPSVRCLDGDKKKKKKAHGKQLCDGLGTSHDKPGQSFERNFCKMILQGAPNLGSPEITCSPMRWPHPLCPGR